MSYTTSGIMVGGLFHTFFGTMSVGFLMKLVPQLFTLLIFAGAAYMAWIGITLVRSSVSVTSVGVVTNRSSWMAFRQGAVTCILNPKGVSLRLLGVSAVHETAIREPRVAGGRHGSNDRVDTAWHLWRTGSGRGEKS